MSATSPTSWPTDGNYTGIRDWLWYGDGVEFIGVLGYRAMYNMTLLAEGKPAIPAGDENAWAGVFLPLPQIASSYADAQSHGGRIHPLGIDMDAVHEYQGPARAVAFERNRLSALALPYGFRFVWEIERLGTEPPTPPDYDLWRASNYAYLTDYASALLASIQPPALPAEGDTPVPVDYPGAPPLGPGDVPTNPPGTPDPNSPPMPTVPVTFEIACEFTGRVKGAATPVQFEDVTLFRLPATGKIEIAVKRADVPLPNFFIASMTDVGFTLTVTRKLDGKVKTFIRPEGEPVEALLYFE
jgi:hypothetical protein